MGTEDSGDDDQLLQLQEKHHADMAAKNHLIDQLQEEILSTGNQVQQVGKLHCLDALRSPSPSHHPPPFKKKIKTKMSSRYISK